MILHFQSWEVTDSSEYAFSEAWTGFTHWYHFTFVYIEFHMVFYCPVLSIILQHFTAGTHLTKFNNFVPSANFISIILFSRSFLNILSSIGQQHKSLKNLLLASLICKNYLFTHFLSFLQFINFFRHAMASSLNPLPFSLVSFKNTLEIKEE